MVRFVTHGFALVAISLVLASSAGSRPAAEVRIASDSESPPTRLLPAQVELDTGALEQRPAAVGDQRSAVPPEATPAPTSLTRSTLGADQLQATVTFDPRRGLPRPGTTASGGAKDKTRPWNSYVVMSTNALSANPLFLSNIANPKFDRWPSTRLCSHDTPAELNGM